MRIEPDLTRQHSAAATTFRRRVFYIPGYDPFHPRRYRELYRKEGAEQARISGYGLALKPKTTKGPYGWHVTGQIGGQQVEADMEVLVWSDIVSTSMSTSIAATYLQLVRTAWAYIGSGALFRLMRLRKGPMIAALYPIVFLLVQLLSWVFSAGASGPSSRGSATGRWVWASLRPPSTADCAGSAPGTTRCSPGT